jgi:1-deoxy-D-xylulose-5-phosphate synthase
MVFVEEGIAAGGFGEYAMSLARRQGRAAAALAVQEHFVSLGTREELLRMNGLDGKGIAIRVREMLFPYPDSLEVSYHSGRGQA